MHFLLKGTVELKAWSYRSVAVIFICMCVFVSLGVLVDIFYLSCAQWGKFMCNDIAKHARLVDTCCVLLGLVATYGSKPKGRTHEKVLQRVLTTNTAALLLRIKNAFTTTETQLTRIVLTTSTTTTKLMFKMLHISSENDSHSHTHIQTRTPLLLHWLL